MNRLIATCLSLMCLFALTVFVSAADEPTPTKKKQPAKTIVDPKDSSEDLVAQGEYVGDMTFDSKATPLGAQVIAQGQGTFAIRIYVGGLPGAGWDMKQEFKATATRGDKGLEVTGKDISGRIADGKLMLSAHEGKATATLKKVERVSPTMGAKAPVGAIVLFDGTTPKEWKNGKLVELSDGKFLNIGVRTEKTFQAFTMHLEFRLPFMPDARGQGRANSGLYLQDRYEVQVLDSFGLKGENNECGGIYTQYSPQVNMCLPPLVWQTYDIDFTPAKFDDAGKKTAPAKATIKHNGMVIHDNIELKGPTGGGQPETAAPGAFQLQNHGNPVVFRNIWVVEKK